MSVGLFLISTNWFYSVAPRVLGVEGRIKELFRSMINRLFAKCRSCWNKAFSEEGLFSDGPKGFPVDIVLGASWLRSTNGWKRKGDAAPSIHMMAHFNLRRPTGSLIWPTRAAARFFFLPSNWARSRQEHRWCLGCWIFKVWPRDVVSSNILCHANSSLFK